MSHICVQVNTSSVGGYTVWRLLSSATNCVNCDEDEVVKEVKNYRDTLLMWWLSPVWNRTFQTQPTARLSSSHRTPEVCERKPTSAAPLSCCGRSCPVVPGTEEQQAGWRVRAPRPRTSASSVWFWCIVQNTGQVRGVQVNTAREAVDTARQTFSCCEQRFKEQTRTRWCLWTQLGLRFMCRGKRQIPLSNASASCVFTLIQLFSQWTRD